MPWWIKFVPRGGTKPVAMGAFDTEEEAQTCLEGYRQGDEPYGPPEDPGELVEAPMGYPSTLPHVMGTEVRNGIEYRVWSDGTTEPLK
jgi:hypothetical protein